MIEMGLNGVEVPQHLLQPLLNAGDALLQFDRLGNVLDLRRTQPGYAGWTPVIHAAAVYPGAR